MKNLLIIIMTAIILSSCGKSETEEVKKVSTELVKPAGPVVKLKYKFKVGDKFSYKLQTISDNTEEIFADTTLTNKINQSASYTFDFRVKSLDEYNIAELEARIKSIIVETNLNGQSMKYDSKFIYSSRERVQFVDYESVKNVPFKIRIDNLGNVVKVDGINRIMKNILEIQNVPDTLSAKNKEQMKISIAQGTLQPLVQQVFKVVSSNPVGIDSVWQINYDTPLAVFKIKNTAVYKVDDIIFEEDTTTSISSKLLISTSGNNVVNEQGMTYTFNQPKLDAKGSFIFNNSLGLVKYAESITKLEMAVVMDGRDSKNDKINSTKRDLSNNTNIVELL